MQSQLLLDYLATAKASASALATTASTRFAHGNTLRLGIAGPPGAGKSTFIEAIGTKWVNDGFKVAVIPVDPSSHLSGGSILGDKTRMEQLARSDNAYIRASPTRGVLGGIAEHTSDVISLCESAGYDIVVVESVGLGQSEVDIDMAVDMLLVLIPPGGGDGLQASKKGIMEAADLIGITKASGDLLPAARSAKVDYSGAMQFIRPKHHNWHAKVFMISSRSGDGLDVMEQQIKDFHSLMSETGQLQQKRSNQAVFWMWGQLKQQLIDSVMRDKSVTRLAANLKPEVGVGHITPRAAARQLVDTFVHSLHTTP